MTRNKHHPAFSALQDRFANAIGLSEMLRDFETNFSAPNQHPPYNLIKIGEDRFRVDVALAGYALDDLSVLKEGRVLIIRGEGARDSDETEVVYIHRGLAKRRFERKFHMVEHIEVESATFENGILSVNLVMVIPEEKRSRSIPISTSKAADREVPAQTEPSESFDGVNDIKVATV